MNYNGNAAYQIEMPAKNLTKAVRKGQSKRAKVKFEFKPAVLIAIFAAVVFLIVYRWITISGQLTDISTKTSELNKTTATNQAIKLQIEQKTKKNVIYEYATSVLGMITPTKSQIVYVNITPEK